jgi:Uma2 family endonuclease
MTASEYLHASFEHDAEFVEGRIVERPAPVWEHGNVQGFLIETLRPMGRRLGFYALPEQRIQTRPDRFRVPDVCLANEKPFGVEWVWVIAPVICTGSIHSQTGMSPVEDRIFATDRFQIDLSEVES